MENIYSLDGKVPFLKSIPFGMQMIGSCGFTQVPEMFAIFPDIIRTIFAENCVAVVFLAAIIMNLIMPKDREAA